jgi:hypothetical protein
LQINLDDLREHYRSLTDDELIEIDREDLTDAAQTCYDEERARRRLDTPQSISAETGPGEAGPPAGEFTTDSDWLADAACACSYVSQPGGSAASDAAAAVEVLQAAGIPCEISVVELDPPPRDPQRQHECRVMVPGALNLKATAILDRDLFNAGIEADWRTHFEQLTDEELRALTPDVICAGLTDRIARLKRAYNDELARRAKRSSG